MDGAPLNAEVELGVQFVRVYEDENPAMAPGYADVLFPPLPDVGDRAIVRLDERTSAKLKPLEEPTWDPLMLMDHPSFAEVGVYSMQLPREVSGDAEMRCEVLFGVNSKRFRTAWPQKGCEPAVMDAALDAAVTWNLMHGEIRQGDLYARFKAVFVFPVEGAPYVQIPAKHLASPIDELPEGIIAIRPLEAIKMVPPKLVKGDDLVAARCVIEAVVGGDGRPSDLVSLTCPEIYEKAALKAVSKWRWLPHEVNGVAQTTRTRVAVKFSP
jgi:hypothetical protein